MKRFFSLMLAVLLLVSALPFAAFATETETALFWIEIRVDGAGKASKQLELPVNPDEATIVAYAKADAEYAAYFAAYSEYVVEEKAATSAAINFKSAPVAPVDPCKDGHAYGEWTETKAATCGAAGEAVRVCANNADHKETKAIAATGEHSYKNGVCACGEKESFGLTFEYKNADGSWTSAIVTVKVGERIHAPEIPKVSGLRHTGWTNGLEDGYTRYYIGMPDEFKATYVESTDDGLVDLTVYAYYYVDGEYHHKAKLFTEEFEESRKSSMVRWLYSNGVDAVDAALAAEHGADGYQWSPVKFYNCYGDGEVTEWEDLKADGNKSVYVKVESKKAIEATILLHIHTAKEYAIARTVKMAGYTAGDFVSYNEALAKVKNYYTGSSMEMSDLYDEGDWEDLMDGLKSSGSKTIKVEDNGTTEIHVILKNATSKTSSNADTTNPKTGDYITIAVGTMVMAAAALVTLTELKKRKMI